MGNIAGIICEYNPFHAGHRYHIDETRRILGKDTIIVCAMSGDFVQRGEPAVENKFIRARSAAEGGADLVLELPLPWCMASAETFARGGTALLKAAGCTHISFGSECGNIEALKNVVTDEEAVKKYMKLHPELTYPAARRAVTGSELLDRPNNLLGIEYLKFSDGMVPVTVKRFVPHDGPGSAKEIREKIPKPDLEREALSRLKLFSKGYFASLPGGEDGLGERLYEAAGEGRTLGEIAEAAKTKRYTMSRVRRLMWSAVLGVQKSLSEGTPPYARVLAFSNRGKDILRAEHELPFVTLPKEINALDERSKAVFAIGASALDFYMLKNGSETGTKRGLDYRTGPVIV